MPDADGDDEARYSTIDDVERVLKDLEIIASDEEEEIQTKSGRAAESRDTGGIREQAAEVHGATVMPDAHVVAFSREASDGAHSSSATEANEIFAQTISAASQARGAALSQEAGAAATKSFQQTATKKTARGAPRVDAPKVDDRNEHAINEDTPGYIPMAFPKLFPHGVGDYHDPRDDLSGRPDFGSWGRYVLQWHDGRFMRHPRFRYWFLDTWLRMKTPGTRATFLKINKDTEDLTLEDLKDKKVRRSLVQKMTTATQAIPGGIGERRLMRQQLESMVDQIETEVLDSGNPAGSLPGGFATLTTAIYKWEQLHTTILKSYDRSSTERQEFEIIMAMPRGAARHERMKKSFYTLAVSNPGAVAWYCAVKLEIMLKLFVLTLSHQLGQHGVPIGQGLNGCAITSEGTGAAVQTPMDTETTTNISTGMDIIADGNAGLRAEKRRVDASNSSAEEGEAAQKRRPSTTATEQEVSTAAMEDASPSDHDPLSVAKEAATGLLSKELGTDDLEVQVLMPDYGQVKDWWASFEWSDGGMVHIHIALWIGGAPRIDKVLLDEPLDDTSAQIHDLEYEGKVTLTEAIASKKLAWFFDRAYTEWNNLKAIDCSDRKRPGRRSTLSKSEQRCLPTPQMLSEAAHLLMMSTNERSQSHVTTKYALTLSKPEFDLWMIKGSCNTLDFAHARYMRHILCSQGDGDLFEVALALLHSDVAGKTQMRTLSVQNVLKLLTNMAQRDKEILCEELVAVKDEILWNEIDEHIMAAGAAASSRPYESVPQSKSQRAATARRIFTDVLTEWVNMHDLHQPFANGPPRKGQPCAKVENEHSTQERVCCGKLFPRLCVEPGHEQVKEDPRRRDLYRLWLARNCNFVNNYIPIMMFMGLTNMDFQATLTKFAVIEYMTKYMTKAGQGSLLGVMENSFSACVDSAREHKKGTGAAVLKWFNLQSITDCKSQLECVHLSFQLPRFLSSRSFRRLATRSEAKRVKTAEEIKAARTPKEKLTDTSPAETYLCRMHRDLPDEYALGNVSPYDDNLLLYEDVMSLGAVCDRSSIYKDVAWEDTKMRMSDDPQESRRSVQPKCQRAAVEQQWWQSNIRMKRGDLVQVMREKSLNLENVPSAIRSEFLLSLLLHEQAKQSSDIMARLLVNWQAYLLRMSWWTFRRLFNRDPRRNTICYKPVADVLVVSPFPRLARAKKGQEWSKAARDALLAYCNHGPHCQETFRDATALDNMRDEDVDRLLTAFVEQSSAVADAEADVPQGAGAVARFCKCPPFVARAYRLGKLRQEKEENKKKPQSEVRKAIEAETSKKGMDLVNKQEWQCKSWATMSDSERARAQEAWTEAYEAEQATKGMELTPEQERLEDVRRNIRNFMRGRLKWTETELHDAVLELGMSAPARPSMVEYFNLLVQNLADPSQASYVQNKNTHTCRSLRNILRILSRTGAKLGGLKGAKDVLAQRLADRLKFILEIGRASTKGSTNSGADGDDASTSDTSGEDGEESKMFKKQGQALIPRGHAYGEIPDNANVDPAQAESALGRNQANEDDDEAGDSPDKDQLAEEEALRELPLNPPGVAYKTLIVPSHSIMADAKSLGWLPTRLPIDVASSLPAITSDDVTRKLGIGMANQKLDFESGLSSTETMEKLQKNIAALDPTQRQAFEIIKTWATRRAEYNAQPQASLTQAQRSNLPRLNMFLSGTAGTGKTHTAKTAILQARLLLGGYDKVLVVAHAGIAAANLGEGATTIDSVFRTNSEGAAEDLEGQQLEDFVARLQDVDLIVIDEISTVGAAQFEMMHRRMVQVAKHKWRSRAMSIRERKNLPDFGAFGGIGVLCMGDFAQLPPVRASTLLPGVPLDERKASGLRGHALTGRTRFADFTTVIRLRRIHRQQKADDFKSSTIRLRDGAMSDKDYELWQSHVLLSDTVQPSWEGAADLQEKAIVLVAENEMAGRVNGQRLRARAAHLRAIDVESVAPGQARAAASNAGSTANAPEIDPHLVVLPLTNKCHTIAL